jgi:exodeoxyribonuclease-3
MKVATLNLWHGGSKRIGSIADYLLALAADVVVCTEFRSNAAGGYLCEALGRHGYGKLVSQSDEPKTNSVALFSTLAMEPVATAPDPVDRHRIVACRVVGLTIAGVYFAGLKAKATLFDYLLSKPFGSDDALVIGDFNTGLHYLDESGATFLCTDSFSRLPDAGLHDLWRHKHGRDARAFSWKSNRGCQFRIDHAFGSARLRDGLTACDYDHKPRGTISDHSALLVDFA